MCECVVCYELEYIQLEGHWNDKALAQPKNINSTAIQPNEPINQPASHALTQRHNTIRDTTQRTRTHTFAETDRHIYMRACKLTHRQRRQANVPWWSVWCTWQCQPTNQPTNQPASHIDDSNQYIDTQFYKQKLHAHNRSSLTHTYTASDSN